MGAFKLKAGVGQEGGGEGFTISSVVSKRLFLATLGSMTSSSGGKILPNVFSVIGNHKMRWPSVSSEPQRICKDKHCTKGFVV